MDSIWLGVVSLAILGALITSCIIGLLLSQRKQQRRVRAVAAARQRYHRDRAQTARPIKSAEGITVAELVARSIEEGRAVRLNWEDAPDGWEQDEEWPTGVLPRITDEEPS